MSPGECTGQTRVTPEQIDAAVATERRRLADHVAGFTDEQWATPSLCDAWTVRDVIAHLTVTTRLSVLKVARAALRARGSFNRMEVQLAAGRAGRFTTEELGQQLRESAESSRRFPGSGPMDPLMDLVIHAQDIARPTGTAYESPEGVVTACLEYVAGNKLMGGPKHLAGVEWRAVEGPEIDLLLVASGRTEGLAGLSGPGVERLAANLA